MSESTGERQTQPPERLIRDKHTHTREINTHILDRWINKQKGSKIDQERAKDVDRILDLQAAEFLVQSSKSFDFDEKTSTPYRRRAQKQGEAEEHGEAEDEESTEIEGAEGLTEAAARYLLSKVTPQKPSRPDKGSPMKETKD